jgi:hypothetical protein
LEGPFVEIFLFVDIDKMQIPADSLFVGGKLTDGKFVRLVVDHIAVNWNESNKTASNAKSYLDFLGDTLRTRFEPKGWT